MAVLVVASGGAMAANYNIILKSGGTPSGCATGGFTFTKTTTGSFSASSPSVTLNGPAVTPCFGVAELRTLNLGALNVVVANVTANGQDQGPNVVSINGSLSSGNGSNHYTITFLNDKSFTVTQNTGQNPQVGSGTYHVYNLASVPEPESLALVVLGLGALALSRLRARRFR